MVTPLVHVESARIIGRLGQGAGQLIEVGRDQPRADVAAGPVAGVSRRVVRVDAGREQVGVAHGRIRRGDGQLDIACHDLRGFAVVLRYDLVNLEVGNLPGNFTAEACRVESLNPIDRRLPGAHGFP